MLYDGTVARRVGCLLETGACFIRAVRQEPKGAALSRSERVVFFNSTSLAECDGRGRKRSRNGQVARRFWYPGRLIIALAARDALVTPPALRGPANNGAQ